MTGEIAACELVRLAPDHWVHHSEGRDVDQADGVGQEDLAEVGLAQRVTRFVQGDRLHVEREAVGPGNVGTAGATVTSLGHGEPRPRSTGDHCHGGTHAGQASFVSRLAMGTGAAGLIQEGKMLWTIFVILLVLWLLGMVSSYTLGGFIHVLLVVALVIAIIQLIQGRRVV
jgi:hypothetical protein